MIVSADLNWSKKSIPAGLTILIGTSLQTQTGGILIVIIFKLNIVPIFAAIGIQGLSVCVIVSFVGCL